MLVVGTKVDKLKQGERAKLARTLGRGQSEEEYSRNATQVQFCASLGCSFLRELSRELFSDATDNDWYHVYEDLVQRRTRIMHNQVLDREQSSGVDPSPAAMVLTAKLGRIRQDVLAGRNPVYDRHALIAELAAEIRRQIVLRGA